MIRDEVLSLPMDWENNLEQMMLKRHIGFRCERVYICSPCRADTSEGVIRNMMAARIYMYYAYTHFSCIPKAPHAYLPVLLNDNYADERSLALRFGMQLLYNCDKLFVCGNRLSDGMYNEIKAAISVDYPIVVFNPLVSIELREWLDRENICTANLLDNYKHLHNALSWGADELAQYWVNSRKDRRYHQTDITQPILHAAI